jgi:aryl-alcohol dehydrogenase-like predicted oxidoreductase
MEYRTLTGTGAKVSRISLGTFFTFGGQLSETDAIRMVHRSIEAGINFIDCADAYGRGGAEVILGKALEGRRDGIVLASKVRASMGPDQFRDTGLARWHIMRGVEASLNRLRTDCLDVLYFHSPDYDTPLEESLAAADLLVRQGKVCYLGFSNYAAWQMGQAQRLAERHRTTPPVVAQIVYNLLARSSEREFFPFCRDQRVGVTIYNPLAGGLLTGKHRPDAPPASDTRFSLNQQYYDRYWREGNFRAVSELVKIAAEAGLTPVSLALRWVLAQPDVDSMIIGASSLEQLEENLTAWEGGLDKDTLDACDQVWLRLSGDTFQYNR